MAVKDAQDQRLPLNAADMLLQEESFLWPTGKPSFRAGLALSGGGVRAATVALGVLQTVTAHGLLARFHYLSTVSGGGYIGSSLSWFWCKKRVDEENALSPNKDTPILRFGAGAADFPFQDPCESELPGTAQNLRDLRVKAAANLKFLRNHGSYLTSGDGIGFGGLIIAVVRTIMLSLAVWLPILVLLFVAFEVVDYFLRGKTTYDACILSPSTAPDLLKSFQCRPSYKGLLVVASLFVLVFFAGTIIFSFLSRIQLDSSFAGGKPPRNYRRITWYSIAFALGLVATIGTFNSLASVQPMMGVQITLLPLFCAACLMLALAEFFRPGSGGYFLRRSFEKYSSIVLPNVVAALFVASLPLIVSSIKPPASLSALGPLGGVVTLLSGVATALYGYYLKAKSLLPGIAGQILAIAGSLLFLSGTLVFSFVLAGQIVTMQSNLLIAAFLSLVVVAFAIGCFGSVNATGLHRFYRDRLMETFMPMAKAVETGSAQESVVADNLSMVDVVCDAKERGDRPYHLINAHAILVNDRDDPKLALRGGDNFLISPAFVGSSATGWMSTKDYVSHHGALTLASAMAVSGAAANANAGYIGTGVTRDRFVSTVMSLLNIRLGLWVGNPRITVRSAAPNDAGPPMRSDGVRGRLKTKVATYFRPVLTCGIFGYGHDREAPFLELSDGGHFENLGLYELVRRKLDLILVVDAEQDSNIRLSALVSSMNRIKEDFGVSIGFLDSEGPERLLAKDSDRYPSGVRIAKSPYLVAEIRYPEPDGRRGVLIYIKSTMMMGLEFATKGYRAINPDFPHQSTADQFFDPDQFEAYRDLGKKSCALMIEELELATNFGSTSALLERYGFPARKPETTGA